MIWHARYGVSIPKRIIPETTEMRVSSTGFRIEEWEGFGVENNFGRRSTP